MGLVIISKNNKEHKPAPPRKKLYIILDQKERMYLSEAGFFVGDKKFALAVNSRRIAYIALIKLNELRKTKKQKPLCTLVYE